MKLQTRNQLLLVLTAMVWGLGFVVQTTGGDALGAFAFNGIRNFVGSAVLLPLIMYRDKAGITHAPSTALEKKQLRTAGIICGLMLFVASSLQQLGITAGTDSGKAGFLTACYIVLVPILGIFLKKRCSFNVWIAVAVMLAGLYLLCMKGDLSIQTSDALILACALCFSFQIMAVDHYSPKVDGVRLASLQFLWVGILSVIPAIINDIGLTTESAMAWVNSAATSEAIISILYAGVFSSGVGYTLQIIAQNGVNPTIASMIMSLESVFAVIFGFIFLHQMLSFRELMGCVIMFVAIIIAQLPEKIVINQEKKNE